MFTSKNDEPNQQFPTHPSHEPGKVHAHDVVCGRGGQSNVHPGNEWFRRLVRSNRALYRSCPKHTKLLVAKAIVQAVHQQDPPGRFMKLRTKPGTDEFWEPITYKESVNKTSQALREKESSDTQSASQRRKLAEDLKIVHAKRVETRTALEIAREAKELVESNGEETPEHRKKLTNVTIQSAAKSDGRPSNMRASMKPPPYAYSPGGKRKAVSPPVKPSWWRMGSPFDAGIANTGSLTGIEGPTTFVSPGMASVGMNDNNQAESNKRRKGLGADGMGRGALGLVGGEPAWCMSTSTSSLGPTPLPVATTLGSRQSTLVRFLNNAPFFRRSSSQTGQTQPIEITAGFPASKNADPGILSASNSNSKIDAMTLPRSESLQSTFPLPPLKEQITSGTFSFSRLSPQEQTMPVIANLRNTGRKSVEDLSQDELKHHQQTRTHTVGLENNNQGTNQYTGLQEEELEDMPTSGLIPITGRYGGDSDDDASSPLSKALKAQMSDWLASFFPESPRHESAEITKTKATSNSDGGDDDDAPIPPPPGVITDPVLSRSMSSTLFGLVESPTMFLTSLKSGVTSLFGDSVAPVRRFPTGTFEQPQEQEQNRLQNQKFGGSTVGAERIGVDEITVHNAVLGQWVEQRGSLLDDIEETPMERELRNAKGTRP